MQNMTQADLKVGMKDKQNEVINHLDGYCKEPDSLPISMENLHDSNFLGKETDNSVLLEREGGGFQTSSELDHLKVVNHVIEDTKSEGGDLPQENGVGEVLYNQIGTVGSKMLTCDEENRDKVLRGSKFERFMAPNDCDNNGQNELPDSGAQILDSKSFQADSTLYTDKSVMECEVTQLIVCCNDIDCQHVKDIGVDKGEPPEEKDLIDKHTDKFVAPHVSEPSIEYWTNETTGRLDYELQLPEELTSPAQPDFSDLTSNSKEERTSISPVVLSESERLQAGKVKENGPNAEKNIGNMIEEYVLVEESLVTTVLPLEKFGTRSFLRSFMDSLNSQGEEVAVQSNQSMKANPQGPGRELDSEKSNQTDLLSRNLSDDDREKPCKAEDVPYHNYRNFTNPLAAHDDQFANMSEREEEYALESEFRNSCNPFLVTDIHHETLLKNMEGHSTNPFRAEIQTAVVEVSTGEILPTMEANHKENFNPFACSESAAPSIGKDTEHIFQVPAESPKRSTNNPFADHKVENADMDRNCESLNQQPELNHNEDSYNPFTNTEIECSGINKIDGNTTAPPEHQSAELRHLHDHEGASKHVSFANPGEAGIGETSFSAVSGRITYSGPIAFSGSTSLRSDSSTTSTRSFAFPVLQSEWNSSPVRMERADRRKLRGGWKHGIFCCKF